MKPSCSSLCVLTLALGLSNGWLAAAESPKKPVELFNGKDLAGWEFFTTPAPVADIKTVCTVGSGGVVALAGNPIGFLATAASYENYQLHVEWRWSDKAGNGGILVHIASGPKDRQWPLSVQVQTKNKAVGDLLPMAGATFAEKLTSAPGAATAILAHAAPDSEKPVGEWNAADIVCRGDTIEVTINGVPQNRITKSAPAAGQIGFQFEGVPYEVRNVRLAPLPRAIDGSYQSNPTRK